MSTLSEQDAYEIVRDTYVYAYPLVLTHTTVQQLTNFAEQFPGTAHGPANRFNHARAFPGPESKVVIRANVDTLYSSATLDLKAEPLVLSLPATDRYFMLPMLSLWSDVFAVPGTRTTGKNTARDFLVTGPHWRGETPSGVDIISSPTRYVWIIGRTQTNGAADYDNVHTLQDGFRLTPLSAWGRRDYTPPKGTVDPTIDMKTPPPAQVDKMNAAMFFGRFTELLADNPPQACDYPMMHRLGQVGIVVGRPFDLTAVSPEMRRAFDRGTADGNKRVAELARKAAGTGGQGWTYSTRGGAYGVDYDYRAAVAAFGLGLNLPQDAIYPSLSTDAEGHPLDGANQYVLRFERGKLPPVRAFWSVTAYDAEGYFMENGLKRQALGDRDAMVTNADGALELYLQADSPGKDKEANWLPVAKSPFTLLLRLYSPSDEILNGSWVPPLVTCVKSRIGRAAAGPNARP